MAPFSVVEDLDIFEQADIGGLIVEPAFVVGQLGLEQMEEGLGHGVVPAVSLAAHALHETVVVNPLGESCTGVLDAAIGMDDQSSRRPSMHHRSLQCDQRHAMIQCRTQCPADHASGVEINEDDEVEPAANRHVGRSGRSTHT